MNMVFQSFNLFSHLSVLDNLTLGPIKLRKTSREEAEAKSMELLKLVGLAEKAHSYPDELSGGQKQRVAIARALGGDPKIILGDEPTAALDTKTALGVMELLRQLATEQQRAVVVVTHDPRLERFADRVARVEDGRVVAVDTIARAA
jgi:polar amino acid transport system ATP-binding protein